MGHAWPLAVEGAAQRKATPVVGYLSSGSPDARRQFLLPLSAGWLKAATSRARMSPLTAAGPKIRTIGADFGRLNALAPIGAQAQLYSVAVDISRARECGHEQQNNGTFQQDRSRQRMHGRQFCRLHGKRSRCKNLKSTRLRFPACLPGPAMAPGGSNSTARIAEPATCTVAAPVPNRSRGTALHTAVTSGRRGFGAATFWSLRP